MLWQIAKIAVFSLCFCLILFLFSCGEKATAPEDKGVLQIFLTDKPLDNVQNVYVTIGSVEVHQTGKGEGEAGTVYLPPPDSPVDLLALQGIEELLSSGSLEDGFYTHIKLEISEGTVVLDTAEEYELEIPSGKVLIPVNFTIEEGKLTKVLLDFDAEKSVKITKTGGANPKYILRPVIKPINVEGPK